MVSIQKFRIIVLMYSFRIEYWSNYSIRFIILNICTALIDTQVFMDNPPESWKIQLSRFVSLKDVFWRVFLALHQFLDEGNIIFNVRRVWSTASKQCIQSNW